MPDSAAEAVFAAHLKRLRAEQGLTYRALAAKCGLAYSLVHRAERSGNTSVHHAGRIAEGLGVPLAAMLEPLTPPSCSRCLDRPPAGFTCNGCGAKGEERNDERGDGHDQH